MTFEDFKNRLLSRVTKALDICKATQFYIEEPDGFIEFKFQYGELTVYSEAFRKILEAPDMMTIEDLDMALDELSLNHIYDLLRKDKNPLIVDYKGYAKTVNETNVQIDGIDFGFDIDFTAIVNELEIKRCELNLYINEELFPISVY